MTEKYFGSMIPSGKNELIFDIESVRSLMNNYEITQALSEIWKFVNETNRYINEKKPWETPADKEKILYTVLDSLRIIGILLSPFIPHTIDKLNKQLGISAGLYKDTAKNLLTQHKIHKQENLIHKVE